MLSWRYRNDIERWAEWLSRNPDVKLAGIDFQDCKVPPDWAQMLEGFRTLVDLAPPSIRFIVYGVAAERKILALGRVTNRLHIINAQPFICATKGIALPSPRQEALWLTEKSALLRQWINYYERVCRLATRRAAFLN